MYTRVSELSDFLLDLQENTRHLDASSLIAWAVSELADILGFDSAWYGWVHVDFAETVIHASTTLNLPQNYYDTWRRMADQDLLVAQFLEDPTSVPTYDRAGNIQTDGMELLADTFGLRKIATAICIRPGRTASFYLSAYRCSGHARTWDTAEKEFLQCAVNNISQAARNAALTELNNAYARGASAFLSRKGNVIMGLAAMQEHFGHLWSRSDQDNLPGALMDCVRTPGEYHLPDKKLILTCKPPPDINGLNWLKLSIRRRCALDILTEREREVACLLAMGKTHKMVAIDLGTAPSTVSNQAHAIYRKLKIDSRADLIKLFSQLNSNPESKENP